MEDNFPAQVQRLVRSSVSFTATVRLALAAWCVEGVGCRSNSRICVSGSCVLLQVSAKMAVLWVRVSSESVEAIPSVYCGVEFFVAGAGNREGATFGGGECHCAIGIGASAVSYEKQEFSTRVSPTSVLQECPARVSHKSVPQQFCKRVSHKSSPQECPIRVLYKSVPQECLLQRVSPTKSVSYKECQTMFGRLLSSACVCNQVRGLHPFFAQKGVPKLISKVADMPNSVLA